MTRLKACSILLFIIFGISAYVVAPGRSAAKGLVGEVPAARPALTLAIIGI
ncbi:MAG: hypothetical protein UZ17_ACD001000944 [Acidobacteria bacterium OLB17]|nr:MAG: hypothetical protein UZ17_ACD001000944 [Acidobacteria bacterium OLB17]